jgi:xylose isomerase
MFYGHIGGMDVSARALLIAEKMIADDRLGQHVAARYAGWAKPFGQQILSGQMGLDQLAAQVLTRNQDTAPVSGRQEHLENLLNSYL